MFKAECLCGWVRERERERVGVSGWVGGWVGWERGIKWWPHKVKCNIDSFQQRILPPLTFNFCQSLPRKGQREKYKEWGKRRTADVMVLGSNGQSPWLQHPKFESWWNLQFLLCTIWWKRSKINKQEAWRDPFFNWYRKYLTNKFQNIAQYKINPAIRCKN